MNKQLHIPVWVIIVGSLLAVYLGCFIPSVFLNKVGVMFCPRYVPSADHIGADLAAVHSFSSAWLAGVPPAVAVWPYPPLQRVLFAPLACLPVSFAYTLLTLLTIIAFLSVILPMFASHKTDRTALCAITVVGLLSYGLQFELERGQCNVIAVALVACALFLYHCVKRTWGLVGAVILFSIAIQLKLYPAIFVLGFTRDARAWRQNLLRWTVWGALNIACLFVLGQETFRRFVFGATESVKELLRSGGVNHSIVSFATFVQDVADSGTVNVGQGTLTGRWRECLGRAVEIGGFLLLFVCFMAVVMIAYRRNERAVFKYLLGICAIVALLLPSVSFDYKLPVITMFFAFFVSECEPVAIAGGKGVLRFILLSALSVLVAVLMIPPVFRPVMLRPSTPFLLAIGLVLPLLMFTESKSSVRHA